MSCGWRPTAMASLVLRPADDGISPVGTIFVPASFITKQNANTIGKSKDFIELFPMLG